jgi:glycine dehydrogenase subunit 1
MMMGIRMTRRRKVVMAGTVSPIYRRMIECYSQNLDVELVTAAVPEDSTCSDVDHLRELLDDETAALLVQLPNAFGTVEDWSELVAEAKSKKIITCCSVYPMALSLVQPPGEMGFDVVTGEAQCFGVPLSFGGPYCGFMATTTKCMRRMPGRIVGRTVDTEGRDGFVLTLQAREQHIRREGAMSNICTNEGLCALMVTVYLATIGKEGLVDIGKSCTSKAAYLRKELLEIQGVEGVEQPSFFNEFVVRLPADAATVVSNMIERGYAAGFPLARYYPDRPNDLLVAVTEKRTLEEMRHFAVALEAVLTKLTTR